MSRSSEHIAATFRVRGSVQGVGFRPFVYRLAHDLQINGRVCNDTEGVLIHAEGSSQSLARFEESLRIGAPTSATIEHIAIELASATGSQSFEIDTSTAAFQLLVRLPRDRATCPECHREIFDAHDRRSGYPFTNCTDCGPRYSIIEKFPYERIWTSMNRFAMCEACQAEYRLPTDRRFHAQPIACRACGPQVAFWNQNGRELSRGSSALQAAAGLIRDGGVLALKGLGGFQLLVRADQSDPVAGLRQRKGRPSKPFAVMVPTLEFAARLGVVGPLEQRLLSAPENPIVLIDHHPSTSSSFRELGQAEEPGPIRYSWRIAPEVAPRLSSLGVFLPTTPLHHLLLAQLDFAVVATSGNRGDEPIVTDEHVALHQLSNIADAFLLHDRPIVHRVDDSVVRVAADQPVMIRLARGYAPLPLPAIERMVRPRTPTKTKPAAWLAVGGHQKVAVALWSGAQAVLAPHLGDMGTAGSRATFEQCVHDLTNLYGCEPAGFVCDLHPDYFTTRWALSQGKPVHQAQHHHAHAVTCMVEHDLLDREVLALIWDGTGFGPDGTVWGGEILQARVDRFERIASLLPFPLPGNDLAIRQPRRTTLGVLAMTLGEEAVLNDRSLLERLGLASRETRTLLQMAHQRVNSSWTSSVGRLFDAVAGLLLGAGEVSYEGEAAIWLESIADLTVIDEYPLPLCSLPDGLVTVGDPSIPRGDWRPMVAAMLADLKRGVDAGVLAARFHNTLARWAATVVAQQPLREVVLGGGCFQNRRLTESTIRLIQSEVDARVYAPGLIPPGDGGLAVGQLAIAMNVGSNSDQY